jgi:hypothetical protein
MCLAIIAVRHIQQTEIAAADKNPGRFEQIKLPAAEATHEYKAGDEISYKGEMYDISEVTLVNGDYIITALPDTTENKLQQLTAGLSGESTTATGNELRVLPFFLLYYEAPVSWSLVKQQITKNEQPPYQSILRHGANNVTTPPPQLFS